MKGVIFHLLESFLLENFGEDTFDDIADKVQPKLITKGPFIGPGTYPDEDLFAFAQAAAYELDVPLSKALFIFGKYCLPKLTAKMPHLVESHGHPRDLLKSVDSVIHVEVKKVFDNAEPPQFTGEDTMILAYRSKRRLYDFAEGLLEGVSEAYQMPIAVRRVVTDDEEGVCEFHLTFG